MPKNRHRSRRPRQHHRRGRKNGHKAFNRTFDPRSIIGKEQLAPQVSETYEVTNAFSDFLLEDKLAHNIASRGFTTPTPIQDQAIPYILEGRDVVGVANTGTGKTAAFLIPLVNSILNNRSSRALIIAPTRELAVQIDAELRTFTKSMGLYSTICIGGVPIHRQIKLLNKRPHFVIGTPGRLLDLESRGKIDYSTFDAIVLDEVDRMLDMGFVHDINKIISHLPAQRQSLFFSATLDEKVKRVMTQFITDPVMISVKTADTSANVYQSVIELNGRSKGAVLRELLNREEVLKTLVFTRTKRGADRLHKSLSKEGYRTTALHGNKSQNQRQRALDSFGKGKTNILIATDVASRGIDINDISHVVNFDLPESYDAYIHRIGRTGRADKKGTALTLVD